MIGWRREIDRKRAIRQALERAAAGPAPDLDRLLACLPALLAEAARRRSGATAAGLLGSLVPLARRAIPRLATATGVIVLLAAATAWSGLPAGRAGSESATAVLLGVSEGDAREDPLLQAIVEPESGRE